MANTYDKKRPTIKNGETLARRAWIESALESVRNHLDASTFLPTTVESRGHEVGHEPAPSGRQVRARPSAQPHLQLVWSDGEDRRLSGDRRRSADRRRSSGA